MIFLALLALAIWLHLFFLREKFWRCQSTEIMDAPAPKNWPSVVAIVPARDEAELIVTTLSSLLAQNYAGAFHVVLVDDNSADGTGQLARALGAQKLTVLDGKPLARGWSGKVWAMAQGEAFAREKFSPDFLLFTDADILHDSGQLSRAIAQAEDEKLGLVSLMANWRCDSAAEKALIPAFLYFFQMIYPFEWVNDARRNTAAAAGNFMLVRAKILARAGGVEKISNALIDDCAFGALIKREAAVSLRLAKNLRSLRAYKNFSDIGAMVSRSAYAQLRFSPLYLAGAALGLMLSFFAPAALAFFAPGWSGVAGMAAYALMSASFAPIQTYCGVGRWRALTLPLIAAPYLVYTLRSGLDFYRGRGGLWKGRAQAHWIRPTE